MTTEPRVMVSVVIVCPYTFDNSKAAAVKALKLRCIIRSTQFLWKLKFWNMFFYINRWMQNSGGEGNCAAIAKRLATWGHACFDGFFA
jgi:hypothetical protein